MRNAVECNHSQHVYTWSAFWTARVPKQMSLANPAGDAYLTFKQMCDRLNITAIYIYTSSYFMRERNH